jgi:hypothetical protein
VSGECGSGSAGSGEFGSHSQLVRVLCAGRDVVFEFACSGVGVKQYWFCPSREMAAFRCEY